MAMRADTQPHRLAVNVETGDLYSALEKAQRRGIATENLVEVSGSPEAIEALSVKLAELCRLRVGARPPVRGRPT
jgi:hypothetical protein